MTLGGVEIVVETVQSRCFEFTGRFLVYDTGGNADFNGVAGFDLADQTGICGITSHLLRQWVTVSDLLRVGRP